MDDVRYLDWPESSRELLRGPEKSSHGICMQNTDFPMSGSCKSRKYLKVFLWDFLASAAARIATDAAMLYKTNKMATFYEVTKYTTFVCANYIENKQDGCSKKRFSAPKLLLGHPCIETTATHEGKTKCFTRPMSCRVMLT